MVLRILAPFRLRSGTSTSLRGESHRNRILRFEHHLNRISSIFSSTKVYRHYHSLGPDRAMGNSRTEGTCSGRTTPTHTHRNRMADIEGQG